MLAFLSGEQGDWSEGLATLNAIPAAFELTPYRQQVHSQMTAYYTLLSDLAGDGKTLLQADSTQVETLKTIEQSDAEQVSAYSRSILLALNETEYEEPIILPDLMKSSAAVKRV